MFTVLSLFTIFICPFQKGFKNVSFKVKVKWKKIKMTNTWNEWVISNQQEEDRFFASCPFISLRLQNTEPFLFNWNGPIKEHSFSLSRPPTVGQVIMLIFYLIFIWTIRTVKVVSMGGVRLDVVTVIKRVTFCCSREIMFTRSHIFYLIFVLSSQLLIIPPTITSNTERSFDKYTTTTSIYQTHYV